jgi:hypothetical protein
MKAAAFFAITALVVGASGCIGSQEPPELSSEWRRSSHVEFVESDFKTRRAAALHQTSTSHFLSSAAISMGR